MNNINLKEKNSSLFTNFVKNVINNPSIEVQKNFMDVSLKIAQTIKKICEEEKLIFNVPYNGKKYWEQGKNYQSCFVDGGVFSSVESSSAPFAIRSKSYIVKPAETLSNREKFEETIAYMGDLYDSQNNIYDLSEDPYEDNQLLNKKKDAARIVFEIACIVKHIFEKQKFNYCLLHGPLQTPVMPFSGPEFPQFKKNVVQNILPFLNLNKKEEKLNDRHFINVYLESLKYLLKSKFPIYGIVEKTNSTIYLRNLLLRSYKKGKVAENDYNRMVSTIIRYKINDGSLFSLILADSQALKPLEVEKQIPSKAWGDWDVQMNSFPKTFIGYLKTNSHQAPIRIESLKKSENLMDDYKYILASSKLLPNYGFPAGLDVVDKAAKIPAWLGRAAKSYYSKYYLDLAIESKNTKNVSSALKMLQGGRVWKNRPRAGKVKK
tara:strand:- start:3234 stop:4535 length:1302 start_codon:yes stop_codon:yes gene_type:complete